MCGENSPPRCGATSTTGSSPRVRGKQQRSGLRSARAGLIPACAGKTFSSQIERPGGGAHPRVCGENPITWNKWRIIPGSSPRVRGKRRHSGDRGLPVRLIPACAGKTSCRGSSSRCSGAHPRVCGENNTTMFTALGRLGSSPRVRGKLPAPRVHVPAPGLIPACAGKTPTTSPSSDTERAHPRVCGENACVTQCARMNRGSSPRVRGKLHSMEPRRHRCGLIPACAGKTSWRPRARSRRGAHPRVCGENLDPAPVSGGRGGSSPRVRGKHVIDRQAERVGRLIPACAGKTSTASARSVHRSAHPRVCGENDLAAPVGPFDAGSSPRVRGKPAPGRARRDMEGLIPACAGKTSRSATRLTSPRAHPRVCGENVWAPQAGDPDEGSSPRVRGKPHRLGPHARPRGLIPACAGKTAGTIVVTHPTGAHPRVCGENRGERFADCRRDGSSPRVRGKHPGVHRRHQEHGLIPACAGKTSSSKDPRSPKAAHPRVCGENAAVSVPTGGREGSSPRVRGKLRRISNRHQRRGLIPACAGKTTAGRRATASPGAHPRVCGENRGRRPTEEAMRGSSPRVRGKLDDVPQRLTDLRLIPACAGKTSRSS